MWVFQYLWPIFVMKGLLQIICIISENFTPIHSFIHNNMYFPQIMWQAPWSPWVPSFGALPLMRCLTAAEIEDFSAKDSTDNPRIPPHRQQLQSVLPITCRALPWCVRHRSGAPGDPLGIFSPRNCLFLLTDCSVNSVRISRALRNDFFSVSAATCA